jgi:hypothetical protein
MTHEIYSGVSLALIGRLDGEVAGRTAKKQPARFTTEAET